MARTGPQELAPVNENRGPDVCPGAGATPQEPLAPLDGRVYLLAATAFAALMALSGRYGFHRDELYTLDAGRHLQGGYVDIPVLTPLLARLSLELFGVSLPGLRLWPALAVMGTVVVGGLLAREMGGARRAQLLAAAAAATMPVVLGNGHMMGTAPFDVLGWAALALVVVHIGRTGNQRGWVLGGLVLGIGLTNKHSIGFFVVAIILGTVLSGGGRLLLNRWALAGAVIAVCFAAPDIWWQSMHGWPTIAMTRSLNQENGGLGNVANWIVGQFLMASLALVWVWAVGLRFLWRSGQPLWRALVWAYGLLYVLFALTTGAKIYYLAGAYVYLLAAGAVSLETWLSARPRRCGYFMGWTAVSTALTLPAVLPVLPAKDIGWVYKLNQAPAESVGWTQMVRSVASVWRSLPAPERANSVIFTLDYGEAGAINELGSSQGLPTAVSGQNNEWFWGPGNPDATTVVAVAPGPMEVTGYGSYLSGLFRHVRVAATLSNPDDLDNQEQGGHVYVCTGPRRPWGKIWPSLRHYD